MLLEGSCHCGAVTFRLQAASPVPYLRCYCSICRKTAGGGGYAINLGGDARTMEVDGMEHVSVYQAAIHDPDTGVTTTGGNRRHFCRHCGSMLWAFDPAWPDLVHPFASAIDTPLPKPPQNVHMMLDFKAPWVEPEIAAGDQTFGRYPRESLAEWHARQGLTSPEDTARGTRKPGCPD